MANDTRRAKTKMEDDLKLIKKIKKTGDEESLSKLIERHSGIYIDMVNKYIPNSIEGVDKEDLIQDKDFTIYESVLKFDENKNTKFSTYVGNVARWKCLNTYNKKRKFPQESIDMAVFPLKKHTNPMFKCDFDIENIENREFINKINELIDNTEDPRVKIIFKMRYGQNKKTVSWKKIAKRLDLSIQGCINIHNNYLNQIKKYVQ
jgi:RNA polymerase sigma factor (sigma-70 family)